MAVYPMTRRQKVYEGKAKILYRGQAPGTLVQYFKDDTTAFNRKKFDVIEGKGVINNFISSHIMQKLGDIGIPTHFIKRMNMREQLIHETQMIPLEVVVRNIAAGSLCKRLGLEEGKPLPRPLIEYYYKNDDLDDPLVSDEHILIFEWANTFELNAMITMALRINDFLSGLMAGVSLKLVDFKIEFGRLHGSDEDDVQIILADEISPDSCRLWDAITNEVLDKDRFRRDMGQVKESYQEVARRLGVLPDGVVLGRMDPVISPDEEPETP